MPQSRRRCPSVGFPVTNRRVVRGGSWNNNQVDARAAYRNFNIPAERNNSLGLRLVCSSHILSPLQRRRLSTCCERCHRPARQALPVLAADHGLRPEAKGYRWRR